MLLLRGRRRWHAHHCAIGTAGWPTLAKWCFNQQQRRQGMGSNLCDSLGEWTSICCLLYFDEWVLTGGDLSKNFHWYPRIQGHTTNNIGWVCLQTGDTTFFWGYWGYWWIETRQNWSSSWRFMVLGLPRLILEHCRVVDCSHLVCLSSDVYMQHVFSVICHVLCSPLKRIWNLTLSEQSKVLNLLTTNLGELNWWLDMCNWTQLWTKLLGAKISPHVPIASLDVRLAIVAVNLGKR